MIWVVFKKTIKYLRNCGKLFAQKSGFIGGSNKLIILNCFWDILTFKFLKVTFYYLFYIILPCFWVYQLCIRIQEFKCYKNSTLLMYLFVLPSAHPHLFIDHTCTSTPFYWSHFPQNLFITFVWYCIWCEGLVIKIDRVFLFCLYRNTQNLLVFTMLLLLFFKEFYC